MEFLTLKLSRKSDQLYHAKRQKKKKKTSTQKTVAIWNWMFRLIQQFQEGKRGGVEEKYANGLMGEQYTDIKKCRERYDWKEI